MKFKRIFLIVCDSMGAGYMEDAARFGDEGANTLLHISDKMGGLDIPNLNAMGINDIVNIKKTTKVEHKNSYVMTLKESSNGKDTMTGHWEMMGILTSKPFKTFTDTGFPEELIKELEEKTGRKIIGNKAASGTEILVELGEEQKRDGSLIVYTSADSVLQIAAHEEVIPVPELYRYCEIAREICNRPEYLLGRIIARPFVGEDKNSFKRTPNRHDLALSPTGRTAMNDLQDASYTVSCVGKINDIFNGAGVTKTVKTVSNGDGMVKTTEQAKDHSWTGLVFTNLVEFDSEYGHRRNPEGYGRAIETFDKELTELMNNLTEEDLLLITADHGNDPTWTGSDHTRERVPFICYSKAFKNGRKLEERNSFADIGKTILKNFNVKPSENEIGTPIEELLSDKA
ncbi:MAG TPA: phosphopentomutase [Firmicutes bacterium]|nr:phosphopentomutase [Bacillota bacterium]